MLFNSKPKGFFVDCSEHGTFVARTSGAVPPFVVEELREIPPGELTALTETLKQLQPKRSQTGFVHATVGMHSDHRLLRRATLEVKRVKENGYLDEVLQTQFKIEPEKYIAAVLNANDGSEYDTVKAAQKDVIFCGVPQEEVIAFQDSVLAKGIYPERVEISSLAALGALVDYLNYTQSRVPTLVLELGFDVTHSFIISANGIDSSRPIPIGLSSMIPVVQKELGLKDEESARKLFFSNTFDFTGMGAQLIQRLLKELQSSIGFYEVQTGLTIGQVVCTQLPLKLSWIADVIATQLAVKQLRMDVVPWLHARNITLADSPNSLAADARWLGVFSLMAQYHGLAPEKKD